jgi:hypothetical protein
MKTKNLSLAAVLSIATIVLTINTAHAQRFIDVIGNPPYGSDPVNGVVGSGATPTSSNTATFANGVQDRVRSASTNLTVANISGSQSVNGNLVNVDAVAAETTLAVANSPLNSNPPAREALVVALGGGIPAQQLAQSMIGLRSADGSIDPVILTGAVSAYNNYMKSLIASSQVTKQPTSSLESYLQQLPPGQKAAQVLLGKLLEATR